jgi:3-oxoacyl-[acyl-carrier protein] reductase
MRGPALPTEPGRVWKRGLFSPRQRRAGYVTLFVGWQGSVGLSSARRGDAGESEASVIIEGAHALVTGGGRGIGRTIALALAGSGAEVAICARSRSELEETAAEIAVQGKRAMVIPTDMTRPEQVHALAERVDREFGGADILVNNAGGGNFGAVVELTEHEFEDTLELNVTSVFRLTRLLLPGMLRRRRGHIIMIASTAARRGFAGGAAYCASKFALNGFAQCLFYETRQSNVRVTTIFPSSVHTEPLEDGAEGLRMIHPSDVALAVLTALRTDDRATVREVEIWGTNP